MFRVQGLGFRVLSLGFRVQGLEFMASGLGFALRSWLQALGFRVCVEELASGFGVWNVGLSVGMESGV